MWIYWCEADASRRPRRYVVGYAVGMTRLSVEVFESAEKAGYRCHFLNGGNRVLGASCDPGEPYAE